MHAANDWTTVTPGGLSCPRRRRRRRRRWWLSAPWRVWRWVFAGAPLVRAVAELDVMSTRPSNFAAESDGRPFCGGGGQAAGAGRGGRQALCHDVPPLVRDAHCPHRAAGCHRRRFDRRRPLLIGTETSWTHPARDGRGRGRRRRPTDTTSPVWEVNPVCDVYVVYCLEGSPCRSMRWPRCGLGGAAVQQGSTPPDPTAERRSRGPGGCSSAWGAPAKTEAGKGTRPGGTDARLVCAGRTQAAATLT